MEVQTYTGNVCTGNQIGSTLGFPTANIENISPNITFENGVYAAQVIVNQQKMNAMLYIGTRPTLNLANKTVEIHIFDFHDDIYGKEIQFNIKKFIREEQRFESLETLKNQLQKDGIIIRNYFSHHSND